MRPRKPVDGTTARDQAVDYLLREFKGLPTKTGAVLGSTGGTTGTSFGMPTIHVAAYNASDKVKAMADFVCDATDDEVEIQAAIDLIGGGVVQLSAGDFYCSDQIRVTSVNWTVWLRGMGKNATAVYAWSAAPTERVAFVENLALTPIVTDMFINVTETDYQSVLRVDSPGGYVANVHAQYDDNIVESNYTAIMQLGDGVDAYHTDLYGGLSSGTGAGLLLDSGVRGSNIDGLYIDGGDGGLVYGIFLGVGVNADKHRISHCRIQGTSSHSIHLGGATGNVDNTIVLGNQAEDGIYLGAGTDGTRIGGNFGTITDLGTNTVYLDNDAIVSGDVSPLTTKGDLWGFDTEDDRIPVGSDNQVLTVDSAEGLGVKWAANVNEQAFSQTGTLSIGTGTIRLYTKTDRTITGIYAMVSGAPSGSAAIFDVNMDGTTVFTTQANRPTIAAAAFTSDVEVPDVTAWDAGSYLTVDVDAANSATDLILIVQHTEA